MTGPTLDWRGWAHGLQDPSHHGEDMGRCWTVVETAWGFAGIVGDDAAVDWIGYPEPSKNDAMGETLRSVSSADRYDSKPLFRFADAVRRYFDREPEYLERIPARLHGTALQVNVWTATRGIPYGQTATYGDIATIAGYPRAARAAGSAMASNAAGLLVPCHRVVAANGLGGYGGRLDRKVALLRLEGAIREDRGSTIVIAGEGTSPGNADRHQVKRGKDRER